MFHIFAVSRVSYFFFTGNKRLKAISNTSQTLAFSNVVLEEKPRHKHLGIALQNNCKWDEHIRNLSSKVSMLINCLRHFKHKLSRKENETMYYSFILPLFRNADIIWNIWNNRSIHFTWNLHLEPLRIITGSVRGTSHQKLYNESGFCTLKERRKRHKLIHLYKIINNACPDYLSDVLPPLASTANPYHRRRPYEKIILPFRTELYWNSLFPSTTLLWNNLPVNIQESSSLSEFKYYLTMNDNNIPSHYHLGNRTQQMIHCTSRDQWLKLELFLLTPVDNPSCACGHPFETTEHFLLFCPNYQNELINTIRRLENN